MIIYGESRTVFLLRHVLNRIVPLLRKRGEPKKLPRLCVFADDLIGRESVVAGSYEAAGIQAIRFLMEKAVIDGRNTSFIDVGANVGTYCVSLAKEFVSVSAFEPHPVIRRVLELNVAVNNLSNCDVFQLALSDRDGVEVMGESRENMGSSRILRTSQETIDGDTFEVEVRAGDPFLTGVQLAKVGLVKIDVEGHELAVVNGLAGLISRDQPVIAFEANTGEAADLVRSRLTKLGYEVFLGLDYCPSPRWLPLRVGLLLFIGVRYSLKPVQSLVTSRYSLVFALTSEHHAVYRGVSS